MSDTQADEEPQCVSSPRVTGADIPEELFEHILWHITHGRHKYGRNTFERPYPPSKHLRVHTLTSLILVCKYFARICRPTLYREVVLRNRQQFRGLLDLLDNGCAPFGKSPVTFTQSLCIEGGEDVFLWIHQLGTVLFPRMKDAGVPFPTVELRAMNGSDHFTQSKPFYTQLPRILPSSLYQHISELRFEYSRFKSGGDLLRHLSSFRGLRSLCFDKCTCGIGAMQPTFYRPSGHLPFPKTTFDDSSSLFPVMASSLLDWYARVNSVPYLLHGQAEMLTVAHIMEEFRSQLLHRRVQLGRMYSGTSHIFSDPRPSIVVKFLYGIIPEIRSSVWLTLVARDITHYDIMIRDNSRHAGATFKVLLGLVGVARLPHLETLRWIFRDSKATSDFVDTSYSNLQRMHGAGQEMKVGYATTVDEEPSDWEPMTSILRRFAPSPKMNVLAEEQAPEATAQEAMNGPETEAGGSTEST